MGRRGFLRSGSVSVRSEQQGGTMSRITVPLRRRTFGRILQQAKPAGFLILLVFAGLLARGAFGTGPNGGKGVIRVDDDGQVAGAPVTIKGSGFAIGENVNLTVTHADGTAEPAMGHETWTVIASDGSFTTTWAIRPADSGSDRFLVRGVGGLSGPSNTASFGRMAWVQTELFDYPPGETTSIRGGGFRAGETVTLQVVHTRGGTDDGSGHGPWTVQADAAGRIAATWYVDPDDSLGAEFLLHARGEQSGLAAAYAFMDDICVNPPPPDAVVPFTMPGVVCPANLNSCSANDVTTTVVSASAVGGDVCSGPDDTVTLDFTVQFATTANQRYDLGFFVASDGLDFADQSAGQCVGAAPQFGAGDGNADPVDCDSDLFLNLDPAGHKEGNPDTCGDLQASAGPVFVTFRATVACNRFDADHNLLVSSCRVWEQNANHQTACTNLAQAGAGSKCDCTDLSFAGLLDPCVTAFCDDGNDCTVDGCDSSGGEAVCDNDPLPDGASCDDDDSCTDGESCQNGACDGGEAADCDDGNVCTDDVCDPEEGCTHTNNNAPCGNGDFCDGAETCSEGACSSPGDACPAGQHCDEERDRCSECTNDSDCVEAGLPACEPESGTCVACTGNEDCADPSHPVCVPGSNTCGECNTNSDCTDPSQPFCDAESHECVECLADEACANGLYCDGADHCTDGQCTHEGSPCSGETAQCDEEKDRCSECTHDSDCVEAGLPACEPESGTCVACTGSEDCADPSHPVCVPGSNTCVQCISDAECNDGNQCNGVETCVDNACQAGTVLGCNDGNPCTADSCGPAVGCVHTDAGDARDGSCESVTDSALCPFPGDTFRLIDLQNPTVGASGTVVQNDYMLNATNPGQAYYNVFYSGTPGEDFSLQINIPWPYVTHGAHPIQVHDGTGPAGVTLGDGKCFAPTVTLPGYTITTDGGKLSTSGYPVILRGDYPAQNLGNTTAVHVSGEIPSTGVAYVTIHLDYGLKKTAGWQQGSDGTTLQGPDNNLDGTLDGFGDGAVFIRGGTPASSLGQDYTFSFSYGPTLSSTVYSVNSFKKNPGVNGLTLNATSTPKKGVGVQLYGPAGDLIATTTTDADGFFSFPYKHSGKAATYTVKVPSYKLQSAVTLKANGYALVVFDGIADLSSVTPSGGGKAGSLMEKSTP